MKITERRLRQLIRSVIKENYNSVPTTPGIYTNHGKHIAGKLWDLLGCREEASEWLATKFGKDSKPYNILLNKVVFGNYGPMRGSQYEKKYAYKAGIYYGGYDWNNTSAGIDEITEDPILKSKAAVRIVNEMMDDLGVDTVALSRRFEGKHMYEELANPNNVAFASQGPGKPPKYAYSSQDPKPPLKIKSKMKVPGTGRHCLAVIGNRVKDEERRDFRGKTGLTLETMSRSELANPFTDLIIFFEDNEPIAYTGHRSHSKSLMERVVYNWINNKILPNYRNERISKANTSEVIKIDDLPLEDQPNYLHSQKTESGTFRKVKVYT